MNNMYYDYMQYQNYLIHYGIKRRSGRYPYGSGERPYQSSGGFFARRKEKKHAAEVLKKKKEMLEKKREEDEKRAKLKETKSEALNTGTARDIQKHFSVMSNQELEDAANRIKWMNEINKYAAMEVKNAQGKSAFDTVNDLMTKMTKVNKWAETSIDAYKNVTEISKILKKAAEDQAKKQQKQQQKKAS